MVHTSRMHRTKRQVVHDGVKEYLCRNIVTVSTTPALKDFVGKKRKENVDPLLKRNSVKINVSYACVSIRDDTQQQFSAEFLNSIAEIRCGFLSFHSKRASVHPPFSLSSERKLRSRLEKNVLTCSQGICLPVFSTKITQDICLSPCFFAQSACVTM